MINKSLSFLFIMFYAVIKAQTINFPDTNFKARLLMTGVGGIGQIINYLPSGGFINIDSNGDGNIQVVEAQNLTSLYLSGASISNFSGIEHFTNLKFLVISVNPIISLDLSSLSQLEILFITNCSLNNLNFTGLTSLKELRCSGNQFTNLDFSGLTNLQFVICNNTQLNTLDFTNNLLFNKLICNFNTQLTSVKIKNGATQLFPDSNYCLFDGNPNLNYICADASEIPIIQAFQSTCSINQACVIDSACSSLGTEAVTKTGCSISPNPSNGLATISLNDSTDSIRTVEIVDALGKSILMTISIPSNNEVVDCTSFAKGIYLIKITTNLDVILTKKLLVN